MPRKELILSDGTEYPFIILPTENGGKGVTLTPQQWQPGHPSEPWRIPLHEWGAGLGRDKLKGEKTYAAANADVSFGMLVPPPLLTEVVAPEAVWGYSNGYYGGFPYGGTSYLSSTPAPRFVASAKLNSKEYFVGGRYCYSIDAAYNLTLEKDFGSDTEAVDIKVFKGNLVVAMGESTKIWEYTASTDTWTQASDNVFAIALGVVGNKLYRGESTNKLSNCITSPRTLSSWVPASPNQYAVGDDTYAIKSIVEYGGEPWVEKNDGIYAPDEVAEFKNQTPQLKIWPNGCDCKSLFTARGYIWAESNSGLLRITYGESFTVGPEKTGKPNFRFHTHGGVQFGDDIYLLCSDRADSGSTVVIKLPAGDPQVEPGVGYKYPYHELVRLGNIDDGSFITVTNVPVLPTVLIGQGGVMYYFKLGRGGGRHIDDSLYAFGTTYELETGAINPVGDLSVECHLQGIEALLDVDSSESITLQYALEEGSYNDLLDDQESGSGTAAITNLSGFQRVRRLAPTTAKAQYFRFKLTGTLDSGVGTDRPELRELWAWGYAHPSTVDIVTIQLILDRRSRLRGLRLGRDVSEQLRQLRNWRNQGTILTATIPDYEESRTTRFQIVDLKEANAQVTDENNQHWVDIVEVSFLRLDYAGAYAS